MKRIVTSGIVLGRLNFGEADRIITIITPDQGKLRLMAKGVRRQKSKMAGGIELLSINDITFIPGRKDIGTLVSSRLTTHFGDIVKNLDRTTLAYEILKKTNDATEDECESAFYDTAQAALEALNQNVLHRESIECWFLLQLLKLAGHEPNAYTTPSGQKLESGQQFSFDAEAMAFVQSESGTFADQHIKALRLLLNQPLEKLANIQNLDQLCRQLLPLLRNLHAQQT